MKIIWGLNKIKKFKKPIVALGVFDGVHRGHIKILKAAVRKAKAIKGTSMVVTFYPHPQNKERIYSLEHRLKLIAKLNIGVCVVIKFSKSFSGMPADDFISKILVNKIGVRYIYIGKNFRFGSAAAGDYKLLKKMAVQFDYRVNSFAMLKAGNKTISSTYIRSLIRKGRIDIAEKLLARRVSILGTVIKGASLARKIGFPTANIDPHHEVLPPSGVYAVIIIIDEHKFYGVCSIGNKPTFESGKMQHIEVHILDFNRNIYGKYLEVEFVKKIREQKKFSSCVSLAAEIQKDIISASNLFRLS